MTSRIVVQTTYSTCIFVAIKNVLITIKQYNGILTYVPKSINVKVLMLKFDIKQVWPSYISYNI
jgi:hypothetical protein